MGAIKQIVRGESNFNIIARARVWAMVSGAVLLLSLIGFFGRGLNLGLEFKGGTSFTVPLTKAATVPDIENALSGFKLGDVKIQIQKQRNSDAQEALVRTKHIERDRLPQAREALAKAAGQSNAEAVSINDVGPTWGRQVSDKALRGLIVFLILVTIYISFRFEPKMAIGALVALFHDLIATAGLYALVGFEVTPATVIALLTLLGYSLYDTVVVFDKVNENVGLVGRAEGSTYTDMVNQSVNQVMMRSINTSLSTLLPIGALLFIGVFLFGAGTLKDLALALFIGTLVGTYSSIFVASPILAILKEREPQYRRIRARLAGGTRAPARVPAPAPALPGGDDDVSAPSSVRPAGAAPMRVHRPTPKPRKRKRGGKGKRR